MNSEYDYSGLYGTGTPSNQDDPAPGQDSTSPADSGSAASAQAQPAADSDPAPAQSNYSAQPAAYPNVGSSGMNTANTARTDYTDANGAAQQTAAYTAPQQNAGGYTSSFGGSGGNGGGYNGYSYASAPRQPEKPRKKGGAKKVLLRVAACLGIVALSVGGGFGGAVLANRMGLTGNQVVVQQVQRDETLATANEGSAADNELTTADVSAIVAPSVVAITTEQMISSESIWFGGSYVQSGAGSGVVMSEDGYILTCAHVVSGANNITVQMPEGDEYAATVVGADTDTDIAVLKVDATGLTPAVMGDSDAVAVGEPVVAVGNPLGMLGGTVTDGIVSAINREVAVQNNRMTLIQTNAAISPGNSGGGLFNAAGELIGITNAKSSSTDRTGSPTDAEGLGFAIPVNTALSVAQELIDRGFVQRPALGITVRTISNEEQALQYGVSSFGVYIFQIQPGSGAEEAGLELGDRIAAVADIVVNENNDLTDYLAECEVGDVVTLQIERDGRLLSVDVTLGASQG